MNMPNTLKLIINDTDEFSVCDFSEFLIGDEPPTGERNITDAIILRVTASLENVPNAGIDFLNRALVYYQGNTLINNLKIYDNNNELIWKSENYPILKEASTSYESKNYNYRVSLQFSGTIVQ